jgi:predicted Rossmann-fold nucleotide-binding protein
MKLLVCGGREFDDMLTLLAALHRLNFIHGLKLVIHGGARGADTLAGEYARNHGIQEVVCPANWNHFGKRAGYERNKAMLLLKPDMVLACPGGVGTRMMMELAEIDDVPVTLLSEV